MDNGSAALLVHPVIHSRVEILSRPCPVPAVPGVYAWYFRSVPPLVPTAGCVRHNDLTLLYVGISPKRPPRNGRAPSTQTIRHRIRYHYSGNAEGSTLRLTLGCLLAAELSIQLRRVGSGRRLTFSAGEGVLSSWMADNALVCWIEQPEPWLLEEELIRDVDLPLNLDQNVHGGFASTLSLLRQSQRAAANALPVLPA